MKINTFEDEMEQERETVYRLLAAAEVLARGKNLTPNLKFECGKVPAMLLVENPRHDLLPLHLGQMTQLCGGDLKKARSLCQNACVAVDGIAQVLVFEEVLKGEQMPKDVKGLRPEVLFAVGQYRNSPRGRAFGLFRGGPEGIHREITPNWEEFDNKGFRAFASVLPSHKPSIAERREANLSLLRVRFEIKGLREHLEQEEKKREHLEHGEKKKRGRGFCLGM